MTDLFDIFRSGLFWRFHRPAKILVLTTAALLGAVSAAALDPAKLPSQYIHDRWQDELPQSHVQDVLQTADGYLWIATQEGLARFDGRQLSVFDARNTPGLASSYVRTLLEDRRGTLWVGTRGGGLSRYRGGSFESLADALPELADASIHALAEDAGGNLWLGTAEQGLWRRRGGRWARVDGDSNPLPGATVLSLQPDAGGLWVGTRKHGLWRLEGDELEPWRPGPSAQGVAARLAGDSILSLLRDADGILWAGTLSHGLARLDGEPRLFTTADGLPGDAVKALLSDSDGNLWVGTYGGGLARSDESGWVTWNAEDGLGSDVVLSLFEDREGSLWIGTEGGGLDRLMDGTFTPYGVPEGLGANYVWSVLEGRDGELWVGTEGGGVACLTEGGHGLGEGGLEILTTADGLISDSVTALWQDHRGDLWIGTRDAGLHRLRDPSSDTPMSGRLDLFTRDQGLGGETVLSLYEDPGGTLWVGTLGGGIDRFDGRRFQPPDGTREAGKNAFSGITVLALASNAQGHLLAGTNGQGLWQWDGTEVTTWTAADGLAHDTVLTLHQDTDGSLWIGTYGGLSRLRDGQLTTFTTAQGLFSDVIFQILEDDQGRLWMSCNQGIFAVEKEQLEAVAAGRRETVESLHLGAGDGMRSAECNGGGQPSGVRSADGRLWFATVRGVAAMDPRQILRNRVPPTVVVESVQVDGEPLERVLERESDQEGAEDSDPTELKPGHERLEIFYAGNSFRAPEQVRFRYRLAGFDRGWIDAGDQRRATYTNLPTGRLYRFEVQAANEDGVWSPVTTGFEIFIRRHFWETPWFYLLVLLAAAALARLVYHLRVRHLLHRTEQLEAKVAERTAEVVAQKDELAHANRELEKLNQVKSEFLAIAAHDIKNPLSLIYGYAGLIAERSEEPRRLRTIGGSIVASVQRILNIVTDLLDTTAIESGKLTLHPMEEDLETLTALAVERNRPLAQEREMRLVFETGGDEPLMAVVDKERIGRVLDNLIGNAVKYAPRRSTVTVRLRPEEHNEGPDGQTVARIEVQDEGPGVPAEVRERIFERFERLSGEAYARAPSTGLGLSIVKHFVELHHGRVWVESEPEEGSTFVVELPATLAE
ncbi:MAG: two-component regulator propeller domain-containing protein [Acidobacteriota bacterium]|nr:two-component regulator propeller domain-containing protein [Acidobacteriota bacterium]